MKRRGTVHLRDDDDWNQTVTCTAPSSFPAGAVGMNLYQDSGMINPNGAGCSTPQVTAPGGTVVDNYAYHCSGKHTLPEPSGGNARFLGRALHLQTPSGQ